MVVFGAVGLQHEQSPMSTGVQTESAFKPCGGDTLQTILRFSGVISTYRVERYSDSSVKDSTKFLSRTRDCRYETSFNLSRSDKTGPTIVT